MNVFFSVNVFPLSRPVFITEPPPSPQLASTGRGMVRGRAVIRPLRSQVESVKEMRHRDTGA